MYRLQMVPHLHSAALSTKCYTVFILLVAAGRISWITRCKYKSVIHLDMLIPVYIYLECSSTVTKGYHHVCNSLVEIILQQDRTLQTTYIDHTHTHTHTSYHMRQIFSSVFLFSSNFDRQSFTLTWHYPYIHLF